MKIMTRTTWAVRQTASKRFEEC